MKYSGHQILEAIKRCQMNESGSEDPSQLAWFYGWKNNGTKPHKPSTSHPMWISSKPFEALRYCINNRGPGVPQLAVVEVSKKCKAVDFSSLSRDDLEGILDEAPSDLIDEIMEMDWSSEDDNDDRDWWERASFYILLQKFQIPLVAKLLAVDGLDVFDDIDQIFNVIYKNNDLFTGAVADPNDEIIEWIDANIDPRELRDAWKRCPGSKPNKLEYEVDDDSIFLDCLSKQLFFDSFIGAGYNAVAENEFNAKSLAILSQDAIAGIAANRILRGEDQIFN